MSNLTHLTEDQLEEEVLRSDLPVLIDFYAQWCGPCKILTPILETLAEEFAGRAKVVKVDVDVERALAGRFQITGVPTLILFDGGEQVWQAVGLPKPQELVGQLTKVAGVGSAG